MNFTEQLRRLRKKIFPPDNLSSWPLISGDTYLALCDFTLSNNMFYEINYIYGQRILEPQNVFLPADLVPQRAGLLRGGEISPLKKWNLVIHNGDKAPSEGDITYLHSYFRKIYSVNWMGSQAIASPIPIGLENWDYLRNGVPSDFTNCPKNVKQFEQRKILLFSSFNLNTNFRERSQALEEIPKLNDVVVTQKFLPPYKYRDFVKNSKFVLSPPGNGFDCHRTWEAIYLGAIPIVKREYWPFSSYELPVLVVNDWNEMQSKMSSFVLPKNISVEEHEFQFLSFLHK